MGYTPKITPEQYNKATKLNKIRQKLPNSPLDKTKFVANKLSLGKYIDPFIDWLYGIALAAALLKDILDWVLIGSLPVIGTVVTIMASMVIFAVMLMTGNFFSSRWARKTGVLLVGTIVEFIFGIDFLPVETAIVIIVFWMALKERKEKDDVAKEKQAIEAAQMQEIYA